MNAQAPFSTMPEQMLKQCPSNATQQTQRNATNATSCSPGKTPLVPDAPNPVDKSEWVTAEMLRLERDAAELTSERVSEVCRKFRTEIGGLYAHIADYLEAVNS